MKLNLGTKLVAGFLPVLATLVTLGAFTYREIDHLHRLSDDQQRAADRQLELMALARDVKDLQAIPLHYLGHPSPAFAQQYEEREKAVRADWERLQASAGEGTEQSRQGFGVVASEVRRLAERAARSAADIADLVNLVQTDTHQVVDIMARGARTAQGGTALAEQARQALQTIQDTVAQTTAEVSAISLSTRQLTAASQMVADSARASATLAEANSAATEEMAAATEEVTSVLEGVVAISTENRDATAAVCQMTTLVAAAMTEMGVAVENLTQTAADLQTRVGRFRL